MGIGSAGGERGILSLPELISSELTPERKPSGKIVT